MFCWLSGHKCWRKLVMQSKLNSELYLAVTLWIAQNFEEILQNLGTIMQYNKEVTHITDEPVKFQHLLFYFHLAH